MEQELKGRLDIHEAAIVVEDLYPVTILNRAHFVVHRSHTIPQEGLRRGDVCNLLLFASVLTIREQQAGKQQRNQQPGMFLEGQPLTIARPRCLGTRYRPGAYFTKRTGGIVYSFGPRSGGV